MKKVIVIGAGPAGLTAAYELLKRNEGYEVLVLEKSGAIGGISKARPRISSSIRKRLKERRCIFGGVRG